MDKYYPTVDADALREMIETTGKVDVASKIQIGKVTTYLKVASDGKPIHKRSVQFNEIQPNKVYLEQATGIAIKLKFLEKLMKWLDLNRKWKEGGFTE